MAATARLAPTVEIIPATIFTDVSSRRKKLRVAAYCRVSTDSDDQLQSYETQVRHYTAEIKKNPDWINVGIFADEGITGVMTKKRDEFNKMIELCRAGKIDRILTKSTSRFARNTVDSLRYIRELKALAPNIRPDIEEEDMLSVIGRMKDGTVFSLDPSWSKMEERLKVPGPGWEVFPKRMEVNITLNGENGTVMADCFGPNVYHNGCPNDRYTVQYTYFDEWIGLIDEFVDNIRNNKTPLINLKWHKRTIEAMNAVYESIATGKAVKL